MNSVSRMVSKHHKINLVMALEECFCTCPVVGTRTCRSAILSAAPVINIGSAAQSYVQVNYWDRTCTIMTSFPCTL